MNEIIIPRLGWSMEEANFVAWLKKDGEPVKSGEPLFTIESEKAAQDIEAVDSGILHIFEDSPQPGQLVKVGQAIGHLLAEKEIFASMPATPQSPIAQKMADGTLRKGDSEVLTNNSLSANREVLKIAASPRARRLASELGVDISSLRGSGRTGRIIENDVRKTAISAPPTGLSAMRRNIARNTSASFSSIPHFYLRCELDATALIRLREDLLPEIENTCGVRLTLTDLLVRAQGKALQLFPAANSIWMDDNIVSLPTFDVGLVVGLTEGIMIPIVRSPEKGNLQTLAQQRSSLVQMARSGKLAIEAMQGGATSLSNLGNTKVDEFAAVIAPGQSSVLAVGRASPRPFVLDGRLAVRTTLRLCLSIDHRVLDGAPAAQFLELITQLLEEPEKLIQPEPIPCVSA